MSTSTGDPVRASLDDLLGSFVVDDYARSAAADDGVPAVPNPQRASWTIAVVTGLIGLLLSIAIVTARAGSEERQQLHAALSERVSSLSATVSAAQGRVDAQTDEVERLRDELLASGPSALAARQQLEALAAGAPVQGPGVTVTVDDAPGADAGSLNRVLDRDLQDVVNALWRAGASAVAVNGHRLTSATAIRSAGEAILVDYQPVSRPYTVTALGVDADGARGGLGRLLQVLTGEYGLVTDIRAGDVALPAGDVRTARFATPQPAEAVQ